MKKVFVIVSLLFVIVSCGSSDIQEQNDSWSSQVSIVEIDSSEDDDSMIDASLSPIVEAVVMSKEDVALHNAIEDCYTIIDSEIYDITSFFGQHPGWDSNLIKLCWTDWSDAFNTKHGESEKAIMTKDTFYIWELSK